MKKSTIVFTALIIQTIIVALMIYLQCFDVAKFLICGFAMADICGVFAWVVEDF